MRKCLIGLAVIGLLIGAIAASGIAETKKEWVPPYKVYNLFYFSGSDHVFQNISPNTDGVFSYMFDPTRGDSSTNGVDSTDGGLFRDTVDFYFNVENYDQGVIALGLAEWDSNDANADADSHYVQYEILSGTKKFGGVYDRMIEFNNDSNWTTEQCCVEQLLYVPLQYNVDGGIDVDSTLLLDEVKVRFVFQDSALVGDAVNARPCQIRVGAWLRERTP